MTQLLAAGAFGLAVAGAALALILFLRRFQLSLAARRLARAEARLRPVAPRPGGSSASPTGAP